MQTRPVTKLQEGRSFHAEREGGPDGHHDAGFHRFMNKRGDVRFAAKRKISKEGWLPSQ